MGADLVASPSRRVVLFQPYPKKTSNDYVSVRRVHSTLVTFLLFKPKYEFGSKNEGSHARHTHVSVNVKRNVSLAKENPNNRD